MIPEYALAYTHLVTVQKLVSSLLKCIGLIFKFTAEFRRSLVVFYKELLVSKVYALNHILQCLTRQETPVRKTHCLFQLRQVIDHSELAWILSKTPIVSLVQGDEMIIHTSKGVYISMDIHVAITATIHLVFVGEIHNKNILSIYLINK